MEIIHTEIKDVLIIEPRVFKDARGYFFESFSQREFDEKVTPIIGHDIRFIQDNESMSFIRCNCLDYTSSVRHSPIKTCTLRERCSA